MHPRVFPSVITDVDATLPAVSERHRGVRAIKRASATEDEWHAGVIDDSGDPQWRRILTETYADTVYADIGHHHDGVYAPLIHDSPFVLHTTANSAATASTTSTSVYSTNVSLSVPLPSGTWTVTVMATGLHSHSSSAGNVAARVRIDSDPGTYISAAMPQTGVRSAITVTHQATGLTGTITVYEEYRASVSGTAYAGGGSLLVIATRTA